MISCPNCGKTVAEDALHCGHCGHKLEQTTSQKTMMGFALSPEDLQKAIQEAGQQRAQQQQQEPGPTEPLATLQPPATGGTGPQSLPGDEIAPTEILPSLSENPALSDTLDPDSDVAADFGAFGQPQFSEPALGSFEVPSNVSEVVAPPGGFSNPVTPDPFASQPVAEPSAMQSMTPMQPTGLETQSGEESFIEKNKKMLIIAGAAFAVLGACCVFGTIYSLFF